MKNSTKLRAALLVSSVAVMAPFQAFAQFVSPTSNNPDALLGDTTAGAESGIYELLPLVITAAGIGIAITLAFVGWRLVRGAVKKVG